MTTRGWTWRATLAGLLLAVAFCPAPAPAAAAEKARPLRFAPLPMEAPETVITQVRPMLAYLEQRLGVDIEIVYSTDYGELLDRFRAGQVDLAYLGPLPYMTLRDGFAAAEPLVRFREASGSAAYTCALVAWGDALPDLARLNGATLALPQPLSTCGYLSTSALLRAAGSDIAATRWRYLGAHDLVALAVIRGEAEVGGLKTAIARKYAHLGLRILAETEPLPSFALIANRDTVAAAQRDGLVAALTALDPAGSDKDRMAQWGVNFRYGAEPAADGDYDALRAMGGWHDIPTGPGPIIPEGRR
ncbi:PhnD/SsuA/transferrin family substrate-binding protein [Caenispirillum bisanense]|uniref:PhnD/SsuA/transferrin family substrate-binding protein n=1 Tax=Caenispirillum bisanense TaxID=414052 RepID=UPI0031D7EF88